jgi:hypothetical protein
MHRFFTALIGAAVLAACSTKDASNTDTVAKVVQTGSVASATAMYDPATRTATVHAKDFAFVAPDTIPAGWNNFHLVNDGPALHHLQIVRLDSGKTAADFGAAMQKSPAFPAWATLIGGPNAPNPGAESNGTLNLEAGNYLMICLVDIPDHVAHVAKGMLHPFVVTASQTAGAEPTSDATVALGDYTFSVTGNLSAGHHVVKVTNSGPQPHEVEIVRFAPGKGMKDLGAWAANFQGPPPGAAIGGVAPLAKGTSGIFTIDLTPGNYALLCFIPDMKDGKPHIEHGMFKEFAVK